MMPIHKCNENDWAQFYELEPKSKTIFQKLTTNEDRGLYCIDWQSEDVLVYGNSKADNFQRIEFVLLPCNYIHTDLGYTGDSIADECVADLEAQIEYLTSLRINLFYNGADFD